MALDHYQKIQKVLDEMSMEEFLELYDRASENINMSDDYELILNDYSLNSVYKYSDDNVYSDLTFNIAEAA